jgi:hypothetical protein
VSNQSSVEINKRQGFSYIDGEFGGTSFYVKENTVTPRPTFTLTADKTSIVADGQDVITISGLPEGECDVQLWGAVNDQWTQTGDIQLTANIPGAYQIRVSQWPYQEQEITFNAS